MNCLACHRAIPIDAAVCPYCGAKRDALTMAQAASMRSYTGAAVLTFFLYLLFFLPGLICNFIYYRETRRMQRIAGHGLPGAGCLAWMLWVNLISLGLVVVIGACLFIALGGSVGVLGLLGGGQ